MTMISGSPLGMAYSHQDGRVPVMLEVSRFRGASGVEEVHLTATPTAEGPLAAQLGWLHDAWHAALDALQLDAHSAVLRRLFCSDIADHADAVAAPPLGVTGSNGAACAVSRIGQAPTRPAKVALWAHHLRDPDGPLDKRSAGDAVTLARGGLRHHWSCGLIDTARDTTCGQTADVFARYENHLEDWQMTLADHVVRTWLFVRDIDHEYGAVVSARRELFTQRGLTPLTHYIASTGIEGEPAAPTARLSMDAYAIEGLQPAQVTYIKAPKHLSPTHLYGVTFERATAIDYADRRQVLVSGTASIDRRGQIVHPGDAAGQVERTLDNIDALLQTAGASGRDLSVLIAYLRYASDEQVVRRRIRARHGGVPLIVVRGAVCRPGWLVEVEAQATARVANPDLPPF